MTTQTPAPNNPITIGRIGKAYGVRGWVHVYSFTDPIDNIIDYPDWHLHCPNNQWKAAKVVEIRPQGDHFAAQLDIITSREAVRFFTQSDITIPRQSLPKLPDDEFYWSDAIGLPVYTLSEGLLGQVSDMMPTGANDVFVVTLPTGKITLVPNIPSVVKSIDFSAQKIVVDWSPLESSSNEQ